MVDNRANWYLLKGRRVDDGFTLAEVIISSALLFMVIGGGIYSYIANMRLARDLANKEKAWLIAEQEMEWIKSMDFTKIRTNVSASNGLKYSYHFIGVDSNGSPIRGVSAIDTWISDKASFPHKSEKTVFDPMGIDEGWVYVYFFPIETSLGNKKWGVDVRVAVSWKSQGQRFGSWDADKDGVCDVSEGCDLWHGKKVFRSEVVLEGSVCDLF